MTCAGIRVGISGTRWTGKTSTIRELERHFAAGKVDVVSLSELVSSSPYPMRDRQTLDGSDWMLNGVGERIAEATAAIQLFDRTPLDILAYTRFAGYPSFSQRYENLRARAIKLARCFDEIFFVSPDHAAWPLGDGQPTQKEMSFTLLIDSYMQKEAHMCALKVTRLPWPIDERISIIIDRLRSVAAKLI